MTDHQSEKTAKLSVGGAPQRALEITRDQLLAKNQHRVRALALPIAPGETIKAQILKAHRSLMKVLPAIKYSRVRDIWHGDSRIRIRGEEAEGIETRWLQVKSEIAAHARAAGEFSHEANAASARIEDRLQDWRGAGEGRPGAGRMGKPTGG